MSRLILVSNRLPITAKVEGRDVRIEQSAGGLATGLRGPHEQSRGLWIGWPGELPRLDAERRNELDVQFAQMRLVPIHLTRQEVRGFYEEISNGILWPLFHYFLEELPEATSNWETFRSVNEKFARAVAEHHRPGDLVWVQDYHLALVPAMVRQMVPKAHIGFFLHVPFPSSEVFSVLPWREEILNGLLGSDLIGFHTASYLRHFTTSLRRVLGFDTNVDSVPYEGREVKLGVFPMGIDSRAWSERAEHSEVLKSVAAIRREAGDRKLLVGIDRLDYTKGIPRRLLAIERLLEGERNWRNKVRVIQLTVPSRERIESYSGFRRKIDELVGRINSTYATPSWVPIHNLHRSLSEAEVAALYRAADVMIVTPLRDGMNLVAKEFVASRPDEDGVLVLSEFAGASAELGEAVQVNPYDIDQVAERIRDALAMPEEERRARMKAMRRRIMSYDVHRWVDSFIESLRQVTEEVEPPRLPKLMDVDAMVARLVEAKKLCLLLDYDGTLVSFAATPEAAAPDEELLDLLEALTNREGIELHVISGRTRASLDRWLGHLPIGLHAEHGLWSRMHGGDWISMQGLSVEWKEKVRPIMEHFTSTTRGAFIEEKSSSIAWHYRNAQSDYPEDVEYGEVQARELRLLLAELLSNAPIEVLPGNKVVEVRPQGVHKGAVVPLVMTEAGREVTILAIGDDRTDEDMFGALPPGSISVHVGDSPSQAQYRVSNNRAVRELLTALLGRAKKDYIKVDRSRHGGGRTEHPRTASA